MSRYLLCTDLDRTLIPNGPQTLSPQAPHLFARLAARPEICLAYVTGRHRELIESAIAEFRLPWPDFAITDVGATIYRTGGEGSVADTWKPWPDWEEHIASDWAGLTSGDLHGLLGPLDRLQLQEKEKQNRHKLSYYAPLDTDHAALRADMSVILRRASIRANLIWSVDALAGTGLLDVLPARAGKLAAIRFLMAREGFTLNDTLFAGDSGNDLDVLESDIPAVLVANADAGIKARLAQEKRSALHIARGWLGMNGNYAAGILEGAAHFWPEIGAWLREIERDKEN